jgi:N-formylglutamate amidohydrolase
MTILFVPPSLTVILMLLLPPSSEFSSNSLTTLAGLWIISPFGSKQETWVRRRTEMDQASESIQTSCDPVHRVFREALDRKRRHSKLVQLVDVHRCRDDAPWTDRREEGTGLDVTKRTELLIKFISLFIFYLRRPRRSG